DVSEGRLPNAGSSYQALPIPSPGGMNVPIEEAGGQEGLALSDALRVTELMYHPVDPETEFIELMNLGKEPLDLTGVRFSEGIDFEFSNFTLESGERIVVVLNETAFKALYGRGIKVAGEYGGNLSNG